MNRTPNRTTMKNLLITAALATLVASAAAQPVMNNKEKMKVFAVWEGEWRGEGWMQMGPGEPKTSRVDEKIQSKLDGTVYLVEGIGKSTNPQTNEEMIVHQALGLISWNNTTNEYQFRTHLKDGRSTDAWLKVVGENKFQWGFEVPGRGQTRYSITLDPIKKTWNEIGEFSQDGNNWSKFFEMNLTKV